MGNHIKIGNIGFDISDVEKLTERDFIKAYEAHYLKIGKGRVDKMKADYGELKKHFTKKRKIKKEEEGI